MNLPPPLPNRPSKDTFARKAWDRYRGWSTWVQIVVALVVVGAIASPFTSTGQKSAPEIQPQAQQVAPREAPALDETPTQKPPVETPTPTPTPKPSTSKPKPKPKSPTTTSKPKTSTCDPNYSGACLKPNVEDYDCAGGSGNGPYYVEGPIRVVGYDHYDLDRDGDGIACE